MKKIIVILIFLQAGLAVSADNPVTQQSSPTLRDVLDYSTGKIFSEPAKIRAIREAGLKAGVQAGMISRSKQIVADVMKKSDDLDRIYLFQSLISEDGVLPPVILETNKTVETKNMAQRIEFAGKTYKIVRSAIFIKVAPTWRDYLFRGIGDHRLSVDILPSTLKPKTDVEKATWESSVKSGWQIGIKQADDIFAENMSMLNRDYMGMLRYEFLRRRGMARDPVIAKTPESVRVTPSEIAVGVGAREIEVPVRMEENESSWSSQ